MSRERLFLAQLPEIERSIRWVCQRRGLRGADAEDFASAVRIRLIENDYEVLAKFEGRCSMRTFLTVVVTRLYLDFQTRRFGKWRSSAEALRLGPVAVRLERLLHRDRLTLDEACGVLGSDPRVTESRDALYEMAARLPSRNRLPLEPAPGAAVGHPRADAGVEQGERQRLADRLFAVIRSSLAPLPARERLFLRLHLADGLSVANVARALEMDQKALYKRKEKLFAKLRAELLSSGIGVAEAKELLAGRDWDAELFDDMVASEPAPEPGAPFPSRLLSQAGQGEGEF